MCILKDKDDNMFSIEEAKVMLSAELDAVNKKEPEYIEPKYSLKEDLKGYIPLLLMCLACSGAIIMGVFSLKWLKNLK